MGAKKETGLTVADKPKQLSAITGNMSREQVELIKSTVAIGATDDELKMFLYTANRTGLDPLARQIYFMKRKVWNKAKNGYDEKVNIQSSIDGFRVVAERSGNYAGQDEPVFEEDTNGKPLLCKVSVYKFSPVGERYPASVGVAYWSEYCPKEGQDFMWQKMPHTMLSKVAEALALRKAFPQDLSGLYTGDEMDQAGQTTPTNGAGIVAKPVVPVVDEQPTPQDDIPVINQDEEFGDDPMAGVADNGISKKEKEMLECSNCHEPISAKVRDYSVKVYGKPLCFNDQKLNKPLK